MSSQKHCEFALRFGLDLRIMIVICMRRSDFDPVNPPVLGQTD
ncbi:hypothetical protein [Paenibacillus durus]|nr:hypothetical protein [Paenibacillus durus]